MTGSSLIDRYRYRLDLLPRQERVSYHQPCHLKIQADPESSIRPLSRIPGLSVENQNSRCRGMIGSRGLSTENYDPSAKTGAPMIEKFNSYMCKISLFAP